jgi:hypothetical protein
MKSRSARRVLVGVAFGLALASPVTAQVPSVPVPPCGAAISIPNASSQFGYGRWIQYTVETLVGFNYCIIGAKVDAFVVGVPGSAVHGEGTPSASARKQVPIPFDGVWITNGTHWIVLFPTWRTIFAGNSQSAASVINRPEPGVVVPEPDFERCESEGGAIDPETGKCTYSNCPILIRMGRGGFNLTSARDGVPFDLNANGVAERVAWTRPDREEAFLAYDRNGNGRIDDGSELFGNHTPVNGAGATASNGFEALKFYLGDGIHLADRLDATAGIWPALLLWTDRNHNGISEPDELLRVADSGIISIGLDYRRSNRIDRFGNEFRQQAEIAWRQGHTDKVFDVWLTTIR